MRDFQSRESIRSVLVLRKLIDLFGKELFGFGSTLLLRMGSLILRGVLLGWSFSWKSLI